MRSDQKLTDPAPNLDGSATGWQPQFKSAALRPSQSPNSLGVHHRPLPSYASEPASTLVALAAMDNRREIRDAGNAAPAHEPPNFYINGSDNEISWVEQRQPPCDVPARGRPGSAHNMAWIHQSPVDMDANETSTSAYVSPAGDLATGSPRRAFDTPFRSPSLSPMRGAAKIAPTRSINLRRRQRREKILKDPDSDDEDSPLSTQDPRGSRPLEADHELRPNMDNTSPALRRRFYHRRGFWVVTISLLVSLSLVAAGTSLLIFSPADVATYFQTWRLCFFLAGLVPIWFFGDLVTRILVWAVEKSMFTVRNALYFAYAIRRPLRNVLRAVVALGWWALMMTVATENQNATVTNAYDIVLKLWACVTLFMTANLLKTLLAKMLALKFNQESHLTRMYDSLKKEQFLSYLLKRGSSSLEQEACKDNIAAPLEAALTAVKKTFQSGGTRLTKAMSEGQLDLEMQSSQPNRSRSLTFWRRSSAPLTSIEEELRADDPESTRDQPTARSPEVAITIDDTQAANIIEPFNGTDLPRIKPRQSPGATTTAAATGQPHAPSPSWTGRYRIPQGSGSISPARSPLRRASLSTVMSASHRDGEEDRDLLPRLNSQTRPDQIMKELAKMERYIRKNTLQGRFRQSLNEVKQRSEGDLEEEARDVGAFLYTTLNSKNRESILPEDLEADFPTDDIAVAFRYFDVDGDGELSVEDCVSGVQTILEERRNLAMSLEDTRNITTVLETGIGVVLHALFVFFYLLVFQANVNQIWLSFSSIFLAFSFMFGNSVRQTFENVLFLFSAHPFDVGDMLYVDNDFLTVEEITINYTVCVNSSNQRVWLPIQKLLSAPLINLTASGNRSESIKILVDMDTPATVVDDVDAAMKEVLAENPLEYSSFAVSLRDAAMPMKFTLQIGFEFSHPGTNLGRCARARTLVFIRVANVLTKLGVKYTWPAVRGLELRPGDAGAVGAVAMATSGVAGS